MDYPYVRVWGTMMGAFDWAIEEEVQKALKQEAPANAIWSDLLGGAWSTTEDLLAPMLREKFRIECQRLGVPHPWEEQPF
jgi:hypothetical protein